MQLSAETRLKAIIDGTQAGTWEWNLRTNEVIFNERWATMLGYQLEALAPIRFASWQALTHPEDRAMAESELQHYLQGNRPNFDCVIRMRHQDGNWRWIHTRGKGLSEQADDHDTWIFGTHIDVTEEKESQLRLQTLAQSLPGIIYSFVMEPDGVFYFTYVSEKCLAFYGLRPDEIVADANLLFERTHPDDLEEVHRTIASSCANLTEWRCQYRLFGNNGMRWFEGISQPSREPDGRVLWHGMVMDITERKSLELKLEHLSVTDGLTGLFNRRHLMRCLEDHIANGLRYGTGFSVIFMDIDFFKSINDTMGHPVGDQVLQQVARLLDGRIRKTDILARTGGEEFMILLPATSEIDAGEVAETLLASVAAERFESEDGTVFSVTMSAGVLAWSPELSLKELMFTCDQCLYRAKRNGRNQVVVARKATDQ